MAEEEAAWTSYHKGILFDWVEQKLILDTFNLQQEDIVLDAGCGSGRITQEIAKHCRKVYAYDSSPKCIEVLNRTSNGKNIEAFVHDMTIPLLDIERVDKVLSTQAIQHIPSESLRITALQNLYDRLKPGGICVATVYNASNHFVYAGPKEYTLPNGVTYARYYYRELASLFQEVGFGQITVRGSVNFRGYRHLNRWGLYRVFKPLALLDSLLSKLPISCMTGALLIAKGVKRGKICGR